MDVDPDDWGRRPTDPRTESQAHRSIYLAGLRAGLRAAGEVAEAEARGKRQREAEKERVGKWDGAIAAEEAARALEAVASRIAVLDAEEVAASSIDGAVPP